MMQSDKKIIDAFDIFFKSIDNIAFLLDDHQNVVYASNSFKEKYNLTNLPSPLNKILSPNSFSKLNEKIHALNENNKESVLRNFILSTDTIEINVDLSIESIISDNATYYLVVQKNKFATQIDLKTVIKDVDLNEKINEIILEVKNSFPFTITSKSRIEKLINDQETPIALKNIDGKYLAANKSFAVLTGVVKSFLQGKNELDFVPEYFAKFYKSLIQFISETRNNVAVEGSIIFGGAINVNDRLVYVPISGTQNELIGILTVLIISERNLLDSKIINSDYLGDISYFFPKPLAIVDNNLKFKQTSKEFCKLVSGQNDPLNGYDVHEYLPYEIVEEIKTFQGSNYYEKNISINEKFIPENVSSSKYNLFLFRSENDEGSKNIYLLFDELHQQTDIRQIFNSRGAMFDLLIHNNPEPIFIYEIDSLRFLEVNEAAVRLYGYSKEEFLQMDLTDLYTPEDIQSLLNSSEEKDAGVFSGPYRHKTRNGSSIFVEISKSVFQFNEKDTFLIIVKDVSARLELEKKNQMFAAAFHHSGDIILTCDSSGFINYLNESGIKRLEYSAKQIESTSFAALVRDEERAMISKTIFSNDIKEPVTILLDVKKGDGTFINADISFTPILDFDDKIESFTVIIKPRKSEIAEVEVPSEISLEKVRSESSMPVNESKTGVEFLSGVFHEILTPMNVILGFAQELSESIESPSEEQKEAAELINQNKRKLLHTMNSVVEYSELLQGNVELNVEEISISDVLNSVDKVLPEILNSPDIHISFGKISSSLLFNTDKSKFESLLFALIKIVSRVIKEKKIYFSSYLLDSNSFLVLISDNYGVSSDYLTKKLSEIFSEDELSKNSSSPKLSVHLSKNLLTILDGKFIINDKFGGGFSFPINIGSQTEPLEDFVSNEGFKIKSIKDSEVPADTEEFVPEQFIPEEPVLENLEPHIEQELESLAEEPLAEQEVPLVEEIISTPPVEEVLLEDTKVLETPVEEVLVPPTVKVEKKKLDISNSSCLYIEDQVDSQILFKVQLKGLKDIKFAVGFEDALPLLEKEKYDFIVMDINLQGEYNGLDALKIINKMPKHEGTPIIAVTAYVLPGDKEKFIAAGFADFVSKPIFREKMIESLEKVIS